MGSITLKQKFAIASTQTVSSVPKFSAGQRVRLRDSVGIFPPVYVVISATPGLFGLEHSYVLREAISLKSITANEPQLELDQVQSESGPSGYSMPLARFG